MEGKGRSQDRPIENVCVSGFYAAMATLHFEFEERETFTDGKHFIDQMIFKHKFSDFMPEMTIELFNKVRARSSYKLR